MLYGETGGDIGSGCLLAPVGVVENARAIAPCPSLAKLSRTGSGGDMRLLMSIFLFISTPVVTDVVVIFDVGVEPGDGVSCEVGRAVVDIVAFAESNRGAGAGLAEID